MSLKEELCFMWSLFIEVMLDYRTQKKYLLHEFVVMPDHFHLILTPQGITLERAMQLIKGGFSFQLHKNLKAKKDVWQPSFFDRRIRDSLEYQKYKTTSGRIQSKDSWQNPRKNILTARQILLSSLTQYRSG